ncbi:MAG: DUF4962 domain-containing protein [Caldilineaceae bacterium]
MSTTTHPHVDPRQPRHQSEPGTNPPVFAWKPAADQDRFHLEVSRNADFTDAALDLPDLTEPIFLPEQPLAPGRYHWRWSANGETSDVFSFEITSAVAEVVFPPVTEWLAHFDARPRIYVQSSQVETVRRRFADTDSTMKGKLLADAERLLTEPQTLAEPPFLPDANRDYESWFAIWYKILWDSRTFVKGAETLALAHLLTGDERFARAACERMASMAQWDPDGSSEVNHNSEAHMSSIWHGPKAVDWVWDHFTEEERAAVVAHFRRRGQNQFNQLRHQGYFGVTRFDSHSGRKIVFLAMTALVFHDEIPEAEAWLTWLRPILCGIWPIWAGDDGAWAEGVSYATAYVEIMTMFATALKRGAGVDLYQRPFWRNHLRWRQYIFPPYAEWIGFGDHTERWASTWINNADLCEIIARETGTTDMAGYIADVRREAENSLSIEERNLPGVTSELLLLQLLDGDDGFEADAVSQSGDAAHLPAAGWAAIRTHLDDPAQDLALVFRSSPYGAISHSHASNNDFFVHVAGKVMAMPSGYYDGYGSNHHTHWVWHTKSHNCVTLSDAPQIMRSYASVGGGTRLRRRPAHLLPRQRRRQLRRPRHDLPPSCDLPQASAGLLAGGRVCDQTGHRVGVAVEFAFVEPIRGRRRSPHLHHPPRRQRAARPLPLPPQRLLHRHRGLGSAAAERQIQRTVVQAVQPALHHVGVGGSTHAGRRPLPRSCVLEA